MTRIFFALLSILAIINTIYARSSLNDFLRRAIKGGVSYYLSNMGAISTDLMKDEDPKEECVFYVNSYQSTREKNAAIAFAAMRNRQLTASGGRPTANTLYDAFDLNLAFGDSGTLMREAMAGGPAYLRSYFKVTSGAYAQRCRGTVWLIVKKGAEIYHDAIWLTDEYPQLIRPGSGVTAIWEIDPAEIEAAIALDNPNHDLHPTPYRGGLPPGTRPPRSIEPITFDKKDVSSIQAKIDEYGRYPDVANGYLPSGGSSSPQCDMSDISRVPYNVFNGVFGTFCKNTLDNPLNGLSQIVDSRGFVVPPRKRSLFKRTPPPNPDTYMDYRFGLSWSGGKGTCSLSCDEAFKAASNSPCGHTAGEQNIMTTSGTVEAGCGQYKWTIIKPFGTDPAPSAPKVSDVKCNAADQFGKHGDISPGFQNQYTGFACVGSARKTIKSGDPEVSFKTVTNGTPYNYKISWLPDCKSTVSEMNVYKPLPNDDKNTCMSLLRKTFTDCNNGGVGGSIDVGCLRYEFHP
ncbi:hypothetical protein MJO28_005722 [Puccinia striiformis f. sp. tritici]|uniref:Uncharacterized protein n=1 Tax=Puccinia striiformis f. sp. tritici TaxID=168172 RepID=A0ACC0EKU5_9BASI|nr:hypothetical protein MJO28_005722 [Puccinia striiformis f. sp. tritici]KAI7960672.1 hypothetical protein MJO29_005740 [Puccinia striiformis f. sp. tritici]